MRQTTESKALHRGRHSGRRITLVSLAGGTVLLGLSMVIASLAGSGAVVGITLVEKKTPSSDSSTKLGPTRVAQEAPGTTSFQSEGVVLAPPPNGYEPPMSAAEASASFQKQDVPRNLLGPKITSATPDVSLHLVTENEPTSSDLKPGDQYPAWVITYNNTAPLSFGPIPDPVTKGCAFVGIYDLNTSEWTTFFQSCD